MEEVKSSIRMVKRGQKHGYVFEVPMNLTATEKIKYAKDKYKKQMGVRAYDFEFAQV